MTKHVNLNQQNIYVENLEYGKTHFTAKVGRKTVYIDVDKDSGWAFVRVNQQANMNWSSILGFATIPTKYVIDRQFVEDIKKIQEAQTLLDRHGL